MMHSGSSAGRVRAPLLAVRLILALVACLFITPPAASEAVPRRLSVAACTTWHPMLMRLQDGIAITDIGQTDFTRAHPIFVRDGRGAHHRYSRVPLLYYRAEALPQDVELIRTALR